MALVEAPLQASLQRVTGVPVRLGRRVQRAAAARPAVEGSTLLLPSPQFPGLEHLLDATEVRLRWHWLDLWRAAFGAPLRLHSLEVATLDAQLVRDIEGRTSWQLPGSGAASNCRALGCSRYNKATSGGPTRHWPHN